MLQVKEDVNLAPLLWYKIGGVTKYLLSASSERDILEALKFVADRKVKRTLIIGLGSNLIFADDYFDGAIIEIQGNGESFVKKDHTVTCFAGESLDTLIQFSFKNNLTGLEWAGGLPGTVGAGVRGNVGAFGSEIGDTFHEAKTAGVKDGDIVIRNVSKEEMDFAYRESMVKKTGATVLNATFQLIPGTEVELEEAKKIYHQNIQHRKDRHPLEYPNCGSVFKNIKKKDEIDKVLEVYPDIKEKMENDWYGKIAVGYLIQKMGLQGYRVGNAQVSEKHALFIVNLGGATGQDVLAVIDHIQEAFRNRFGFSLEVEPEIVK